MNEEFDFSTGMPSEEMAQYLQMFVDETSEQLDELVEALLVLERNPTSTNQLNESFRLIHSIKGAAAMMGLDSITLLTHHLENHFERLRSGLWTLDGTMMDLVLKCVDYLREATIKLREGKPLSSAPELIERLSATENQGPTHASALNPSATTQELSQAISPRDLERLAADGGPVQRKRVIVYLDRNIELPELKAQLILARLQTLGSVVRSVPEDGQLESVAQLGTLHIWIDTDKTDDILRSTVDVIGVEMIEIDPMPDAEHSVVAADDASSPGEQPHQGPDDSAETENTGESDRAIGPKASNAAAEILGATLQPTARPQPGGASRPAATLEPQSKVAETVRVDLARLDRLMNLAGELIVNRARFVQLASQMKETFQKSGLQSRLRDLCESLKTQLSLEERLCSTENEDSDQADKNREIQACITSLEEELGVFDLGRRSYMQLHEAIDQYSRVSDGLQRGVLDTRMVPVGPLFNRFKRTIRDISAELGKKVNLVIRGENTELDKRMIDELGDPLIHLVRNAIDHGLESEAVRLSRGKPAIGTLSLEAEHRGNNVLITVSDDGGGIHTDKVKSRAIERGLVSPIEAEVMTDFEIQQYIWAPGFSTAEVVSDISGRGVGMDIVRTRIRELSGTIEVHSKPGQGTQFVVRLPMTLAIIRSLLFGLQHGTFAAPIEHVNEIVSIHRRDIITVHHRDSIEVRGEFIPLVGIDEIFQWSQGDTRTTEEQTPCSENNAQTLSVLILSAGGKSLGLVVADLRGCQDIVVKSLDENFTYIRGLSGASILGDGSVCLLLDVASCIELSRQRLRDKNTSSTVGVS